MTKYEVLKLKIKICRGKMKRILKDKELTNYQKLVLHYNFANRVKQYELQLGYCATELALKKYKQQIGA